VVWAPVRSTVRSLLGLEESPTEERIRERLATYPALEGETNGLLELFGHQTPLRESPPSVRRDEIIASSWKLVLSLCNERRLLVFEDLDLYDFPSRLFVQRLATSRSESTHLCLLVTSTVPFLEATDTMSTLELSPLPERSVSLLVNELFSRPTDSWGGVMSSLVRASKGNPLWLEQALALATESGTESDQPLPDVLATRISRLPSDAQQVLQALAVLGVEAPAGDVAGLLENDELSCETLQLLSLRGFLLNEDECRAAKVKHTAPPAADPVAPNETSAPTLLKFSHPFMVPLIREMLPAEVRQSLNELAAGQLRNRGAPSPVLAHHEKEACRYQEAIVHLEEAGLAALGSSDPAGAIEEFRSAVDIARWKLLTAEDDPDYIKLNYRLGQAMQAAGDIRGAHVVLRYAESYSTADPRLASQVRRLLAKVLVEQGRPVRAVETLKKAIGDAIVGGDVDILSEMYLELGELLVRSNDIQQALEELDEGMDLVTVGQGPASTNGPRVLWKLLLRMAQYRARLGGEADIAAAVELSKGALQQAKRVASAHGAAESHLLLGELFRTLGRSEESEPHFTSAFDMLKRLGDRKAQVRCLLAASDHKKGQGRPAAFRKQAYQLAWEIGWDEGMKKAGMSSTIAG
jgi:tetratricopeptide (TPR) repeat protein